MKKKVIKFAGPSKKMMAALENEGLSVDWPTTVKGENDLAVEGTFYTGCDWEKIVTIDLRDKEAVGTKSGVDNAIAYELREAYEAFDVNEELKLNMEGSAEEREARGVPDAARLLEDMQEQGKRLQRFAEVAEAVAEGRETPPKEQEPQDGETIHITPQMARDIAWYLKIAYPMMNNLGKSDVAGFINALNRKLGVKGHFRG